MLSYDLQKCCRENEQDSPFYTRRNGSTMILWLDCNSEMEPGTSGLNPNLESAFHFNERKTSPYLMFSQLSNSLILIANYLSFPPHTIFSEEGWLCMFPASEWLSVGIGVHQKREPYLSLKRARGWETAFHSETPARPSPGMRSLEHALNNLWQLPRIFWGPLNKPGQKQLWKMYRWCMFLSSRVTEQFFFPNLVSHLQH